MGGSQGARVPLPGRAVVWLEGDLVAEGGGYEGWDVSGVKLAARCPQGLRLGPDPDLARTNKSEHLLVRLLLGTADGCGTLSPGVKLLLLTCRRC